MSSIAVGLERISRVIGYQILKGIFNTSSPNLPQYVAIFAEANEANQSTVDFTTPRQITSAQAAGDYFGYGSPIYLIARILFPLSGGGLGGIPVWVYPQAKASGATAKTFTITSAGVATGNGTHTIFIDGRAGLDGQFYNININTGDTAAQINAKISAVINNVLGAPVTCSDTAYAATITSKWRGATADGIDVSINNNGNSLGITYAIAPTSTAVGIPSVAAALALIGNTWVTQIINSYGMDSNTIAAFEAWNGTPSATNPTGRFATLTMKPAVVLTGSVLDDPSSLTDSRKNDVTIAVCPAPGSKGLAMEAAANVCVLLAPQLQNNPELDISGQNYLDMPTPSSIGSMATYNNRDVIVKKGCSTVDLVNGTYQIQDLVTTYHPTGDLTPSYRYVRSLYGQDLNIYFGMLLLQQINVIDHVIVNDSDTVAVSKVVKPKQWKMVLNDFADDLGKRALIADVEFMKESIVVNIGASNPDRLETYFKYKRSGYARIASTTAEAGFNFGSV